MGVYRLLACPTLVIGHIAPKQILSFNVVLKISLLHIVNNHDYTVELASIDSTEGSWNRVHS